MHLQKLLTTSPAHLAEFRRLCADGAMSGAVLSALKIHPLFAGSALPMTIAHLRERYDCKGMRGCIRPNATAKSRFYAVRPRKDDADEPRRHAGRHRIVKWEGAV